jgi:hypothetical protein
MNGSDPSSMLGRALLELRKISKEIDMILRYLRAFVPPYAVGTGEQIAEDLSFLLEQLLVVKLHCFLEVKGRVEGEMARLPGGDCELRQLSPITARLNQSRSSIRVFRNTLIAHGQAKGDMCHPMEKMLGTRMGPSFEESLLLAFLACELMMRLQARYCREISAAEQVFRAQGAKLEPALREQERKVKLRSVDDVNSDLEESLARVPKL